MYDPAGKISQETRLTLLALTKNARWKPHKADDRHYETVFVTGNAGKIPELAERWGDWHDWQSAFFLKIPPGGAVHKHVDAAHNWNTYHVVVKTNAKAICYLCEGGEDIPYKLKLDNIYKVDRQTEHFSVNDGKSDRIHLLVEVRE